MKTVPSARKRSTLTCRSCSKQFEARRSDAFLCKDCGSKKTLMRRVRRQRRATLLSLPCCQCSGEIVDGIVLAGKPYCITCGEKEAYHKRWRRRLLRHNLLITGGTGAFVWNAVLVDRDSRLNFLHTIEADLRRYWIISCGESSKAYRAQLALSLLAELVTESVERAPSEDAFSRYHMRLQTYYERPPGTKSTAISERSLSHHREFEN